MSSKNPFIQRIKRAINIKHNWAIKILSIILAFLFWIYVMDKVNPQVSRTFYSVPINLVNQSEVASKKLEIMEQYEHRIDVELVGRRNSIMTLNNNSITLLVDLSKITSGDVALPIDAKVDASDVNIKLLMPASVRFKVDEIVSVAKPVKYIMSSDLDKSLQKSSFSLDPSEIIVTGPKSLVGSVSYLQGIINGSEIKDNTSFQMYLRPLSEDGTMVEDIDLDKSNTTVRVDVRKTRLVPIVFDYEVGLEQGFELIKIDYSRSSINIVGPVADVDACNKIKASKIMVVGKESYSSEVDMEIPENISIDGDITVIYNALIEPIITKEALVPITNIDITNAPEGFGIEIADPEGGITVKITGAESRVEAVNLNQIQMSLDLDQIDTKIEHRLVPKIEDVEDLDLQVEGRIGISFKKIEDN